MPHLSPVKHFVLLSAFLLVCGAAAQAQDKKATPAAKKPAATPAKTATTAPATADATASDGTTAAAPAGANTPATLIDKFFKLYEKEGSGKAVKFIFKTNKMIDTNRLTGMIVKLDSVRSIYGLYTGKDLILQHRASNSLILYSYLVKHEHDLLRFTFIFYKPKNEWEVYRMFFDGSVADELQNSAKVTGKP